jgi:hypothetical protein
VIVAQVIHGEFGPANVEPAGVLQKTYSVAALNLSAPNKTFRQGELGTLVCSP